jgi:predicted RNase H-like HicB family nuclease
MKKITYSYKTVKEKDGGYSVICSDHPGILTQGDSLAHAKEMAAEATEAMIHAYSKKGLVFPPADAKPKKPHFTLDFDFETGLCLSKETKNKTVKA